MVINHLGYLYKVGDRVPLEFYRRVADRWEKRGRDVYDLASALNSKFTSAVLGSGLGWLFADALVEHDPLRMVLTIPLMTGFTCVLDGEENIKRRGKINYTSEEIAIDPMYQRTMVINYKTRLFNLLVGLAASGYSIYGIVGNAPIQFDWTFLLTTGLAYIGVASSQYLKDRGNYLKLDKLKTKIKELVSRIKDFIPKPVLAPKPAFQSTYEQMLYSV